MAKDPTYLAFLEQAWEGLEAVFLGTNAHLFLAEAGRLPKEVAGGEEVAALAQEGYTLLAKPWHRVGRVYSTRGGLSLLGAFEDWIGKAIDL